MNFHDYQTNDFYDELIQADGQPRDIAAPLINQINTLPTKDLRRRQLAAERALYQQGITFSVYNEKKKGAEKIFPFDIIPRIIAAAEWDVINKGLEQRITALNLFIDDVYNTQNIFKDKIIPKSLVLSSASYLKECQGFSPPNKIWIHITGTDIVRDRNGIIYVLEDNLRCPSGISYVLQNRVVQKHTFPKAFNTMGVRPVSNYGDHLFKTLCDVSPRGVSEPNIIVLTPGIYNSAYYEHSYLALQMGVPLAQGSDLVVVNDHVMLRTTNGFQKIDVIYRRIDDAYLDPTMFNKDSVLGVPGIMRSYFKGNVNLVNAPGTGIADDKAIYPYVPKIIKYYLGQDPIIANVPTYACINNDEQTYVLENLESLVVKAVDQSGGYGMLIGQNASAKERAVFAEYIKKYPRKYIAQPTLSLSRSPTIIGKNIEGRHIDFRPFILNGESIYVLPGGLTRVALTKDSLVVNSSQGGGSKDTWVLANSTDNMLDHAHA